VSDSPDYILDIGGSQTVGPDRAGWEKSAAQAQGMQKPWIAITWTCCSVYSRVYRNRQGDAYEGQCPKCSKRVRVRVGPGGTNVRFFDAV